MKLKFFLFFWAGKEMKIPTLIINIFCVYVSLVERDCVMSEVAPPPPTLCVCLSCCCCSAAGLCCCCWFRLEKKKKNFALTALFDPIGWTAFTHRGCRWYSDAFDPSSSVRNIFSFIFYNEHKKTQKEIGALHLPLNLKFFKLFRPSHDVFFFNAKKKITQLFGTWNVYTK